jgi:hypothetical protein
MRKPIHVDIAPRAIDTAALICFLLEDTEPVYANHFEYRIALVELQSIPGASSMSGSRRASEYPWCLIDEWFSS